MRLSKLKTALLLFVCQLGIASIGIAQHYLFIEAERQQPFYLKRGNETYSSTASGFIILSKLSIRELEFIIGFPNKLYAEVAFKISNLEKDRGFALKQLEGKGWSLIDRNSSEVISGGIVDRQVASTSNAITSAGFATLLADATGDQSLIEIPTSPSQSSNKSIAPNNKAKPSSTNVKPQQNQQSPAKPKNWGVFRSIVQIDDSALLRIVYFEKNAKEKWDTIFVEIEKPVKLNLPASPIIEKQLSELASTPQVAINEKPVADKQKIPENLNSAECIRPVALPKELRDLQRRIAKASSFEEQLNLALKSFSERCYTTKQVKELGNLFWEEQERLLFFSRLRKWVSDPALYGELEQSFIQEGSKKAFREMLKQQPL